MITEEQAKDIRQRYDKLNAWIDSRRGRNGWASYKPDDKPPEIPDVSNDERSQLEVYDFCNDPPDRYFLYVNESKREATTWTGDKLGVVTFGQEYRDNFGGKRVSVWIEAINGKSYHGTYFKSSGDYARVKLCKGKS